MRTKIANAKNSVKSHIQTNRAKYATVVGFTAGVVATREVYIWTNGFAEIMADDSDNQ